MLIDLKNIYNVLQLLRLEKLSNLTSIQALNIELSRSNVDWQYYHELDEQIDEIQYLYFANRSFEQILKLYDKILIIDCIYKTNKYRMLLAIISEITNMNIFYYIEMCFLKNKDQENYNWLISTIVNIY